MKRKDKSSNKIIAVDLFCGVGGLTYGLQKAGIDVRLGVDIDPLCQYPYTENNRAVFLEKSVDKVTPEDINEYFGNAPVRLLAGCAPCQTFSSYYKKAKSKDRGWFLLDEFSRLVQETTPELVTMENVPGLAEYNIFNDFVNTLENMGYQICFGVVNCEDYGLAQNRKRLVLLASQLGPIKLLSPKSYGSKRRTVKDVIGKLRPITAGNKDPKDSLHQSASLSPLNIKRIRASMPGGTWRDWPDTLVANCHRKETGKTYSSVYGRMSWDEPSPTITTQFYGFGNGRFGHPAQNRAISLREGAMLQGFPKSYKFVPNNDPINKRTLGRLIGNAVPVKLGEVIGKSILQHVNDYNSLLR